MTETGLAIANSGGMADLFARIAALDVRLRGIDPSWVGLSATASAAGVVGSNPADSAIGADAQNGASTVTGTWDSPATFAQALAGAGLAGASPASANSTDASAAFVQPVAEATLTQAFGPTTLSLEPAAVVNGVHYAHFHDGLDLAAPLGTPVRAAAAGKVISAGRESDGAVVVAIRHPDGSETLYGHLQPDLPVTAGDEVVAGQQIGQVGLTGNTTGPHLHFELVVNGQTVDPEPSLEAGHLPGASSMSAAGGGSGSGIAQGGPGSAASPESPALASASAERSFDAVASSIPYANEIRSAASAAGIDPLLLASLVRAESGFHADAVSSAGALGLTQLMPRNVESMNVGNPFDPARNLAAGARYLANNLHLYGRVDLALAAYEAGKGAVAQAGGIPDSPTTRNYVSRILGYWAGYLGQGQEAAA